MPAIMTSKGAATPRSSLGKENVAKIEVPLDFSFLDITIPSDIESEEPRQTGKKVGKTSDSKYDAKCLKLNNNLINDVSTLGTAAQAILKDPMALSWIDLSCNEIQKIDPIFCDFPKLQILYLHGNQISDIREADKLAGIASLKKLCLHGNPIENSKGYRSYIVSIIPQLISFDMSPVTKQDRKTAETLKTFGPTKKKKRQTSDD